MTAPLAVVQGAAVSEPGRRPGNQDAALVASLPDGTDFAAVADGMGGAAGGAEASSLALATIRRHVERGAGLVAAIHAANDAVRAEAVARPELRGMGTTVVAVLRRGDRYVVAHVGDSRAYRIDDRGIAQLTDDHSFVAEAVRSGHMTAEEASRSRWRNSVTRAVGASATVAVDSSGPHEIGSRHAVLLCSDGVYRVLSDQELHRIVWSASTPTEAVRTLASAAFRAGSDDNISAAVLLFTPSGPAPRGPGLATSGVLLPRRSAAGRGAGSERHGWTYRLVSAILGDTITAIVYKKLRRS